MTNEDLCVRLRSQPFVTEEDAMLACRALGGSFAPGAAASTQGGGALVIRDWHDRPLVGRSTLGGLLALLVEERLSHELGQMLRERLHDAEAEVVRLRDALEHIAAECTGAAIVAFARETLEGGA
jgi:hypothetical protein